MGGFWGVWYVVKFYIKDRWVVVYCVVKGEIYVNMMIVVEVSEMSIVCGNVEIVCEFF